MGRGFESLRARIPRREHGGKKAGVPLRSCPTGPVEKGMERRFPIAELLTDKFGDEDRAIGNRPS